MDGPHDASVHAVPINHHCYPHTPQAQRTAAWEEAQSYLKPEARSHQLCALRENPRCMRPRPLTQLIEGMLSRSVYAKFSESRAESSSKAGSIFV